MSKNGKKAIYVNSNIYSENVNQDNFTKDSVFSQIPDKIRYYSANFWSKQRNELVKANVNPLFSLSLEQDNVLKLTADKTKFFEEVFEDGLIKHKFNSKAWKQFVEENIPEANETFEDFYFKFPEPVNLAESPDSSTTDTSFINKEFVYNFFSPKFEGLVNDQLFDVNTLPTIYNILNDENVDKKDSEENLFVSLGGLIPQNVSEPLYNSVKENNLLKEYFKQYVDAYTSPEATGIIKQIKAFNSNVILNSKKLSLSKKINNKFIPFPFYSDIKFTNISSEPDDFVYKLRSFGNLDEELLSFIQDQYQIIEKNFIYDFDVNAPTEVSVQEINLKNWISSNLSNNSNDSSLEAEKVIKYTQLLEYIKDNVKSKARKYSDLTDKSSEIEVLFYKIEKRQFNFNKKNKPISTFYVLPDQSDIINYIDTQIKYGTEYFYSITAYTLIIGTEYNYSIYYPETESYEKNRDIESGVYKIKVSSKPSYKIYELKINNFSGTVYEKPYTKPAVNIVQQDDKLLFNLLDSDLKTFEKFNVIENNDFKLFESIRMSQDNEDGETIESRINLSGNNRLQIFRTTNYPKNYLAFQGKLYKTIVLENNQKSYLDDIVPNIKYYYVFRFLNEHDVPSNTSLVKEIMLKNEDGYYYLESKTLDLEQELPRSSYKGMKRYLLIRPSIIQTQPKFTPDVQSSNDIQLGPNSNSLWDKDFELSIKSNKSNRILKFLLKATINKKKQ